MLTEDQINEAGLLAIEAEYGTAKKDMLPFSAEIESASGYGRGFCKGAEYAQEQLSPKWVPCKHKDALPEGYYMLLFKVKDIEGVLFQEINKKTPRVLYYNIVAYCRINLPESDGK